MLDNLLLLDIETVPGVESYESLSPDWQVLWWDKISKTVPENISPTESYRQKAGILAEFGKIICISTAYFYDDEQKKTCLKVKSIYGNDEKELLTTFTKLCNKMYNRNQYFQFAGHNIREFDIPYICRRMVINNLPLPEYLQFHEKKPWEVKMFDTLTWWKFGDHKNYISLHLLANILHIPTSKTDMDGSMVQQVYYKDKDVRRIADYCERDVVATANIILRFQNLPILEEGKVVIVA
ncbi:ribonuclease H-like domain-containing protein [Parasediminibacterium sp. JCM 36343]|uniref:ribonuclease H-like domain-containing protein n=1 Tax=Parasediminibacterium sp. JCM 36343 TaxID=3374279 RepID=UPI00397D2402